MSQDKTYQVNPNPCVSCPYRKDTHKGLWSRDDYEKLLPYDEETFNQPTTLFMCHHTCEKDGGDTVCKGWLDVHGQELLSVRFKAPYLFDAKPSKVPLYESGRAVVEANLPYLDNPSPESRAFGDKMLAKYERLEESRLF